MTLRNNIYKSKAFIYVQKAYLVLFIINQYLAMRMIGCMQIALLVNGTRQIKVLQSLYRYLKAKQKVRAALEERGTKKTRFYTLIEALKSHTLGIGGISRLNLCAHQFQNLLAESSLEEIKWDIESYDFVKNYY
ncbi:hypothetical protein MCO_00273 [Bartonella sp. DB5-6]|uniref:hypothetical protein n=1 Tax=Bartonella sp. DB5-6 TaxID=1094755 RepID=UPI00026E92E3|nr:hypothetical protein MCO_00273 [Bartonella sp. DB5-6]